MDSLNITDISEFNDNLTCSITGIHISIINAVRRTTISDIPALVIKTTPYEENQLNIISNTSRFNNEVIKQRLSCIPIHISDMNIPYDNLEISINVVNDTPNILLVTTENIKIRDTSTDSFISENEVRKIFPPNRITKEYIEIIRLRPRLSEELKGEEFNFTAKLKIATQKENGMFNVVHTCSFSNKVDPNAVAKAWEEKLPELKNLTKDEIDIYKINWDLLEAKRYILNNSFDFVIQSIGIYTPTQIIKLACDILVKQFKTIYDGNGYNIKESLSTMTNAFDITFDDEDYTIGKVLEHLFYKNYYIDSNTISYVSFYKSHPHTTESILRVAFNNNDINVTTINQFIMSICNEAIGIFENFKNKF